MANAKSWPSGLPKPTLESAQMALDWGYQNSTMASGMLRQRQKFANAVGESTVTVACNTIDAARMMAFLADVQGAAFDMDLNVPIDPDNPIQTVSARFMGKLNVAEVIRTDFKLYAFNVFIEEMAPTYAEDSDAWVYYDTATGDFDAYAQAVEDMINTGP